MSEKKSNVPDLYLPIFCKELYQMVHSGIPPAIGLPMLKEEETEQEVLKWLTVLCDETAKGAPLYEALRATGSFPDYMTDMVELAERTGHLENVLSSLASYYDRQNRIHSDIRNAVTVPVILFVVMVAVVILLVTQVLPIFDRVFRQLGVKMGAVASGLMQAGSALAHVGTFLAVLFGLAAAFGLAIYLVQPLREKFLAWFNARFGGKGLFKELALTRFSSAMAMASSSGLGMEESLELSGKLCSGSKEIDDKVARCKEMIGQGAPVADALTESGLYAGRDSMLLKLASRTGALPETLSDIAARKEEEYLRSIDHIVSTIEPAIVVISSALSGVILLSVMLPLAGLLSALG